MQSVNVIKNSTRNKQPKAPRIQKPISELSLVERVRVAFSSKNRLGGLLGALMGGLVPLASYHVAHTEMDLNNHPFSIFTAIVLGCLIYSASSVYQFGKLSFRSGPKAFGFVLLTEGILIFSHIGWLSVTCLVYLIVINAISAACNIVRK